MLFKHSISSFLILIFAVAFLTACQLIAPYKGPIIPMPVSWKNDYTLPDADQPTIPKDEPQEEIQKTPIVAELKGNLYNWWEVFNDPLLNELEEQALNSSFTLWSALEKVLQARAQAAIQYAPLFPQLSFSPAFSRQGFLLQNPLMSGSGGGKPACPLPTVYPPFTKTGNKTSSLSSGLLNSIPNDFRYVQTQYLFPLNLNYELDLWNQVHNAFFAASNAAQASTQAYLGVLLSLTADVATAYFQIRGLDAQENVLLGNIKVRQEAVNVNRARFNAGVIVFLDVSRAEVELARAQSDYDDVKRLRGNQENLLATLVGTPAQVFCIPYDPLLIPPPLIPKGLPSELLCRRPDIAEAERNLSASYHQIGVAYANFFPSLNLNAALGFGSPFAHQLFSWKSRFWKLGWQVFETVFDAGRNQANYEYYQSLFRESLANYEETVLEAFKDVEDALVDLHGYADRAIDLAKAVKYANITFNLAKMRYDRGLTDYLSVVDSERQLLETEQNAVIVLGDRYLSTVKLIRALGGGWGPCED